MKSNFEIKINKEIRDYTESIFFGLSLRQSIFSIIACIIACGFYFLCKDRLGTEMTSWLCMLGAAPFAAFGFETQLIAFFLYRGYKAKEISVLTGIPEWTISRRISELIKTYKFFKSNT